MTFATLFLVAAGLSADAFAVALGWGLQLKQLTASGIGQLAITFALFQGIMPIIGWAVASQFRDQITGFDHWIAFVLLTAIGGKMIWESIGRKAGGDESSETISVAELMVLGVATSIDALAVGISFAFLDVSILGAAILIAATTFVLTAAGVLIGHRAGIRFRGPAEVIGGFVLVGIGVKILLDHTGVV